MKVLIIGGGGREHAIAIEVAKSPKCDQLFMAPGNPGMESLGTCVNIGVGEFDKILKLVEDEKIDFTIVGPEIPLVDGLADKLNAKGHLVFGPSEKASAIEGSKAFSKDLMAKYNVPTAKFETFTELEKAQAYIKDNGAPIVVKASGLAAGKGAIVCMTEQEALDAVDEMLGEKAVFGESGKKVVIEEFMEGEEASIFALCNGEEYVVLAPAQDHKRIGEGDTGLNTGGMGAYAPAPLVDDTMMERVKKEIIDPTLKGLIQEDASYLGVLYVGIMATQDGPKVVEYNCRFGDPEAQIVLPLYKGDVLELLYNVSKGDFSSLSVSNNEGSATVVIAASGGYPGSYEKGKVIEGLENSNIDHNYCVHAGTSKNGNDIVTSGGRVLGAVGIGKDLQESIDAAYKVIDAIHFDGMVFRRDIGKKGLTRLANNVG